MALFDSVVAYWRLDEASGTRNDSVGSSHLTDVNTVTQATGKVGSAGQFTRANSEYLNIADNVALSMGDIDFSIGVWVYLDSEPSTAAIFSKDASGSDYEYGMFYYQPDDRFYFWVGDSGGGYIQVAASTLGAPSTGTWYFLVGYHDATNNIIGISGNAGVPNTEAHTTGVFNSGGNFRIGADTATGNYFDGRIDEVGVWKNYVLTSADRTFLYAGGVGRTYPFSQAAIAHHLRQQGIA